MLNKNYLFLINPKAGKGNGQKASESLKITVPRFPGTHTIIHTEYPKHATEIIKARQSNFDTIISVGGDGTLNEIVNGLDLTKITNLGLLPVGSGNDYSSSLKLSKSFQENIDLIFNSNISELNSIRLGKVKIDTDDPLVSVEHRFINALGVGFDAIVAHHNQEIKILSGVLSYITAIFKTIKEYVPIEMHIELDNETIVSGKKLLVTVGKGKTSGGGFYLTPNAEVFSDQFEICIIEHVKTLKLLRSLPKALINKLDTLKEAFFQNTSAASLKMSSPTYIHADGEVISRMATNVNVELLKGNIKVISNLKGAQC
ncbi:MAG: YegS/Rv2252/BmrU family lipid kinase [Bacteroidetes bacterium]|nr:YegS/Rv2252/BmrU family lipid kinase [Bacteroidota bacterium]